jgi:hypothetical protein
MDLQGTAKDGWPGPLSVIYAKYLGNIAVFDA